MVQQREQTTDISTLCVHAGTQVDPVAGGANSPVIVSTACAFPNATGENIYPRYFNTPNQQAVAEKVAALEGAEVGVVFASGMAAISTALLAYLKPEDHAIFQGDLYGGTHQLVTKELQPRGINISWARDVEGFKAAINPATRLIYIESPSNPLLRCLDLAALSAIAREQGVLTMIDNTFATPINQRPLELGIDMVLHSATKYLNGHSDLNAGVVVGTAAQVAPVREAALRLGGMLDAQACYQLERGIKTLSLRVDRHNQNALTLAQFLESHPAVARVYYPGLKSHVDHEVAARQMSGFGGMLSFELKAPERVDAVLDRFRMAMPALSLGGVETLVCVPARTSHREMSVEERLTAGISDGLIRVSVGIEGILDLELDFAQALEG